MAIIGNGGGNPNNNSVEQNPKFFLTGADDSNTANNNAEKGGNLTRRSFLRIGAVAAAAALVGNKALGGQSGEGTSGRTRANPEELDTEINHEQERFATLRETFRHIEGERFSEDSGRILNDPDTVGGHAKAYDAGVAEGNERTQHWVAYKNDLLDNPDFRNLYADESYAGLETADDYGAFYEHIAYSTRPVAAAELIALKHPDFAGLSLEAAENKLAEASNYNPDDAVSYKEWLQSQYAEGKTTYDFVKIPNGNFTNLGIEDRNAEHGMFTECSTEEILRDEKGQLVKASTKLDDGTQVVRYINPVCNNILNLIVVNGKEQPIVPEYGESDNPENPKTPDEPKNPDNPKTPEDPDVPEELEPKNYDNLERIDSEAHDDIANDINTEEINIEQTTVEDQPVTYEPSSDSYEGTGPSFEPSEPSQSAEPVSYSSPENDYSQDLGRANPLPDSAVQPDTTTPVLEEAPNPTTTSEAADALSDLGIN